MPKNRETEDGFDKFHREPFGKIKTCRKCREVKPSSEFKWKKKFGLNLYYRIGTCAKCWNIYQRARLGTPRGKRMSHGYVLKKLYGLTLAEYEATLEAQGGLCAICRCGEKAIDPRTKAPRRLAVDHNRETGQIRGLLCTLCNQGIGQFYHRVELLQAAIAYIQKHTPS